MLSPAPNQRFQSAQEVLSALSSPTLPTSVSPPPAPPVRTRLSPARPQPPVLVLALLIVAIGLLGGGIWWFIHRGIGGHFGINTTSASPDTEANKGSITPAPLPSSSAKTFAAVKNVPSGLFSEGGSTTWAPIRQTADPVIQTVWPQFQLRYTQPINEAPGSGTGIKMLLNDQLTFSQSSRPIQNQEYQQAQARGFALQEIPVAIDGIAVVINPNLKIPGLTVAQLKGIYSGRLVNWDQVGGPNLPITPYSRRLADSGTVEFFVDNVLGGQNFSKNVKFITTTTQALRAVANNLGYIYYASAPEIVGQCSVRPLPLGSRSDALVPPYREPFIPLSQCPSQRNQLNEVAFKNGQYPITRQLFVIVKQNGEIAQRAGEAYANLLLTNQGQELIRQAGFVRIR
ncbi:MAG: PstS family phosphate ABC transporter substrate-binding protein [Chroococcidiopsidaceae cyanobacterium CP_BM_ER_R8_30]|nr:PstS family phosphate ABC transporter substrate-binding protein [Chroococcidiopsidaceae cyanobacterium CP_BM_ER_R8_30]